MNVCELNNSLKTEWWSGQLVMLAHPAQNGSGAWVAGIVLLNGRDMLYEKTKKAKRFRGVSSRVMPIEQLIKLDKQACYKIDFFTNIYKQQYENQTLSQAT